VSYAGHSKIHTNLAALTVEIFAKTIDYSLVNTLCNANNVLCSPALLAFLLFELGGRCVANGALSRCCVSLVNITAY
jgi:hypothetical protein